jgi:outer membrane protein insertion porin family
LAASGLIAFAQSQSPRGAKSPPLAASKLLEVKVTGSHRFTSEEIAAASGLPVGATVVEEDFRKAARQLGETGAFSGVSFTYFYSSAGTKLAFQVADADKFVPAHFMEFVWFSDQELFKKIHDRIPLFTGELPATGRLADQVSDVLQALLVENNIAGHVEYLRAADKSDHLEAFDYSVSNVSIRIRQVDFSGVAPPELPLLTTAAEKLADREYSRGVLTNFIEHTVLPMYRERGYLKVACAPPQPKVIKPEASKPGEAESSDTRHNRTIVDIELAVTPGIEYKLAGWSWSGEKEISADTLQPLIHAKIGQPANTVQLDDDIKRVQELYGTRGFVTATIKAHAQLDNADSTATYLLEVHEGPVYRMGELAFRGIDNTLEARLRAAWKIRAGDVYDVTYLQQYLSQARKLLPASVDWEVSSHVTAISRDKTIDVDLQYMAKAPR